MTTRKKRTTGRARAEGEHDAVDGDAPVPKIAKTRATPSKHPAAKAPAAGPGETGDLAEAVKSASLTEDAEHLTFVADGEEVSLTNLKKPFWPARDGHPAITKGDLLRYYLAVSGALLPHLRDRAMVMKRYPNGIAGDFFFMKRTPSPRPPWLVTVPIEHGSGSVIDFPMVNSVAALLWTVNLGCIDLNPWYARRDDVDRPDYLHFDLDPGDAPFERVREVGLLLRESLRAIGMPVHVKTSGSKGLHLYVPIVRGPRQKEVWTVAKAMANAIAAKHPSLATAEYRIAKRPEGRVLIDYNQNAWGRTLASVYSVRPHPLACVSTPLTWEEVEQGAVIADFRIDNVPARVRERGDLWAPMDPEVDPEGAGEGRFRLEARS